MFPADLDDEQRANLAHKHPTDLDSGPSSPSSGLPPLFESPRRPKSAARHRSHTATDGSTSSSHLLARLVSREEEVRELNAALAVSSERLEAESSRANAAERRALDYFHRLRIATENRERAEQESTRLREELKLYKLQLDNAQREIFRAQDIIDQVASQRNEAEAEAAKARTKARKLQEEKLVMLAREEGRRMGYREGLSIGRRIGYDEGRGRQLEGQPPYRLPPYSLPIEDHDGDENAREHEEATTDEERNDPRSFAQLRSAPSIRQPPMRSESAPPIRSPETAVHVHVPPLPVRIHTHSQELRMPSPPRGPDEPETIHPIPIRPSPIIPSQPIGPHSDGWIPRADSRTSYNPVPSPHGLQQPVPSSPSSAATEIQDPRHGARTPQPTPIPPPVRARDYAYQLSVPPPIQPVRTNSLASRSSTHISQYDLVKKRPGSSLRHEIYIERPRTTSQHSRESASRSENRDQERRYSDRTEAESIIEQWRADSDVAAPSRNNPRSLTPGAAPPRRPAHYYYQPQTATPLGDVETNERSGTPVPPVQSAPPVPPIPESTTTPPPTDDPANTARSRTPLSYLRQRFRQRRSSGSTMGSTVPNIVVESPSEPEDRPLSPSAPTIAAQPELLSPEAANRPLPRNDAHAHPSQPQSQSQSHYTSHGHEHDRHDHHHRDHRADAGQQAPGWPPGFVPYAASRSDSAKERDRDREGQRRPYGYGYADPPRTQTPAPRPQPGHTRARSNTTGYYAPTGATDGYARTRTRSASSTYEAAPLPPGVTYPAPPTRPHTSHRRRDSESEWEKERERAREREKRRDSGRERGYRNRERDADDEDDETLTRSPAPLGRPISLFDSDEA